MVKGQFSGGQISLGAVILGRNRPAFVWWGGEEAVFLESNYP